MKLSFVIPAHNEEKILVKCLESIIEKTQNKNYDVEIIVVNNASIDRTEEIARSFPGIKVVNEPKLGLPQARQSGYLASTGDLIANIDADTLLPENWIETVFQEFSNNPELVALSGPYIYYDLSRFENILIRLYYYIGYLSYAINHYFLHIGAMLQGGNFVLRRSALRKIGGFNTDILFYGEDTDIAKRIQKIGRVKFTFKLPMKTSGRRLKKEGMFAMALKYSANYIWMTIFKKPFHKNFRDISLGKK